MERTLTMRVGRALALVAAAVLWFGACVQSEVTTIGPRRPGLPPDCPVELFLGEPSYPVIAVAKVRMPHCGVGGGRCAAELRSLACSFGANTIFGLSETITGTWTTEEAAPFAGGASTATAPATFLTATLALRTGGAITACNPICSPGFACQSGQCVPQRNPACGKAQICNRNRVCETPGTPGG